MKRLVSSPVVGVLAVVPLILVLVTRQAILIAGSGPAWRHVCRLLGRLVPPLVVIFVIVVCFRFAELAS
jgi:hypothetical protein